MIGAIMGDACDRLPVVMLINAAIQSVCSSPPSADHDMKGGNATQSDQQAHGQHSTHWLCSAVQLSKPCGVRPRDHQSVAASRSINSAG
jgi:hypothetical protein